MLHTNNRNPEVVVALDIGTTKVCAVAGRKNKHGKIEILGVGKVNSEGVLRGVVTNIEKMSKAIGDAVKAVERIIKMPVEVVHVGIAGQHVKSLQHRGILTRDDSHTEISTRDIEKLINDMYRLVLPPGDQILGVIPQEYTVDNEQGIADPVGMSGIRLEANFHIITGQIAASNNIHRCVNRCGLKVRNMTLEPIGSALAVLSDEEKEAGVALVDIGGGTTDIAIFQEGIIRHTAVIPFGGNVVTKDIKEGCTVMRQHAEKLKVKFGSALATEVYTNRMITIPGLKGRDPKEISEKNLALIIQSRVEEILDYVYWEIKRSGYERKLIGGIVLTGGGALLKQIDKLAELHTGISTRVGLPVEHLAHGYHEQICSPIYATAIGLLIKGIEDTESGKFQEKEDVVVEKEDVHVQEARPRTKLNANTPQEEVPNGDNNSWYEQIFKKTKEWFAEEPDSEF